MMSFQTRFLENTLPITATPAIPKVGIHIAIRIPLLSAEDFRFAASDVVEIVKVEVALVVPAAIDEGEKEQDT
jgi:hypothetical protein